MTVKRKNGFDYMAHLVSRYGAAALTVLALGLLVACGSGESTGPGENPQDQVSISINPPSMTLAPGDSQQFTATVSGSSNTAVNWQASGGTINGNGNTVTYTAPEDEGSYMVTVSSVVDSSKTASATVTIAYDPDDDYPDDDYIWVWIDPPSATLAPGATQQFTAHVDGTSNTAVTWSATGGQIAGSGETVTYTAPDEPGSYEVTATSVADPGASATAFATVASGEQSGANAYWELKVFNYALTRYIFSNPISCSPEEGYEYLVLEIEASNRSQTREYLRDFKYVAANGNIYEWKSASYAVYCFPNRISTSFQPLQTKSGRILFEVEEGLNIPDGRLIYEKLGQPDIVIDLFGVPEIPYED